MLWLLIGTLQGRPGEADLDLLRGRGVQPPEAGLGTSFAPGALTYDQYSVFGHLNARVPGVSVRWVLLTSLNMKAGLFGKPFFLFWKAILAVNKTSAACWAPHSVGGEALGESRPKNRGGK